MYNEEAIAADCARTLHDAMAAHTVMSGDSFEIIFCDDGSRDQCAERVREVAKELSDIKVVGYSDNRGKGSAVREAIANTDGDIVIYTDCDLAYGTDVIGEAVERMKKLDCDLLIGSRNLSGDGYEGYTFLRRLMSKTYILVLNLFAGFSLSDSQCGFKAFRGDVARRIFPLVETNGFAFDIEALMIATRMKLTIAEMGVKIINHRESKVSVLRDSVRMLNDLRRIKKRVKKLDL